METIHFSTTATILTVVALCMMGCFSDDTNQTDPAQNGSHVPYVSEQSASGGQFFPCENDCEDDIGDSCNFFDEPCCFPLTCVLGRCAVSGGGGTCAPINTPCVPGLNQCCTTFNQQCLFNPFVNQYSCQSCGALFQPCTNPNSGFLGSCCLGFVCVNGVCYQGAG